MNRDNRLEDQSNETTEEQAVERMPGRSGEDRPESNEAMEAEHAAGEEGGNHHACLGAASENLTANHAVHWKRKLLIDLQHIPWSK